MVAVAFSHEWVTEESPDSVGQDAGESPRRGDPWKVQQKADRLVGTRCEVRVKR